MSMMSMMYIFYFSIATFPFHEMLYSTKISSTLFAHTSIDAVNYQNNHQFWKPSLQFVLHQFNSNLRFTKVQIRQSRLQNSFCNYGSTSRENMWIFVFMECLDLSQEFVTKIQTCDAVRELLKVTVPQLVDRLTAFGDGQKSISTIIRYLERRGNEERSDGSKDRQREIHVIMGMQALQVLAWWV